MTAAKAPDPRFRSLIDATLAAHGQGGAAAAAECASEMFDVALVTYRAESGADRRVALAGLIAIAGSVEHWTGSGEDDDFADVAVDALVAARRLLG